MTFVAAPRSPMARRHDDAQVGGSSPRERRRNETTAVAALQAIAWHRDGSSVAATPRATVQRSDGACGSAREGRSCTAFDGPSPDLGGGRACDSSSVSADATLAGKKAGKIEAEKLYRPHLPRGGGGPT